MSRYNPKTIQSRTESFRDSINAIKDIMLKYNITIDELVDNINVDKNLLYVLFKNDDMLDEIDILFKFFKTKTKFAHVTFSIYNVTVSKENHNQVKIKRRIHPYFSVYYDRKTRKLYKFTTKQLKWFRKRKNKDVFINDVYDWIDNHLDDYIKRYYPYVDVE